MLYMTAWAVCSSVAWLAQDHNVKELASLNKGAAGPIGVGGACCAWLGVPL